MTLPQAKQIFAHLMEVSRKRALRPLEKRTLVRARQTLRSHKKSTSNPRKMKTVFDVIVQSSDTDRGQLFRFYKQSDAKRFMELKPGSILDEHRIGERVGRVVSPAKTPNPLHGGIKPEKYWYDKGFDDALLGIRKRNRMKSYVRGWNAGNQYAETRIKHGFGDPRPTRKHNAALPVLVNPKKGVKIYENVLRVEAQKGPGHRCDPGCKKMNHCYYHNFKRPFPSMFGLPDKSLLIRSK